MTMTMQQFLDLAMVDWQKTIDAMPQNERHELESYLAALAQHSARASAYISRRVMGGKHEDAVKRQNEVARKVRQALGYTYADDKVTF